MGKEDWGLDLIAKEKDVLLKRTDRSLLGGRRVGGRDEKKGEEIGRKGRMCCVV